VEDLHTHTHTHTHTRTHTHVHTHTYTHTHVHTHTHTYTHTHTHMATMSLFSVKLFRKENSHVLPPHEAVMSTHTFRGNEVEGAKWVLA